jgi:Helix-turn-helix domain
MTIPAAAQYMGGSRRRLYRLARQRWGKDRFPAFKIRGTWYVDRDTMLDWMFRLLDRSEVLTLLRSRREAQTSRAPAGEESDHSMPLAIEPLAIDGRLSFSRPIASGASCRRRKENWQRQWTNSPASPFGRRRCGCR